MARRQIKQAELARRLDVNDQWISVRLRGVQPIDLNDLAAIAKALGVDVSALLPERPEKTGTTSQYPQVTAHRAERATRVRPPSRADATSRPPSVATAPHRPALLRASPTG